ncbi:MAG: carboxypeptidase regulatory-like domain-containing protein [Gemmatimonadaceae bacterium]
MPFPLQRWAAYGGRPSLGLAIGLVVVAAVPPLAAQGPVQSVVGVVRDTAGVPLGGAQVQLGQRHTTTNALGAFRVDSVRPGEYPLTIRLLGYAPVRTRVAVVATAPTELEYFLVHAPVVLPTLMVPGRRTGIYGTVGDTAYRVAVGAKVELLGPGGGTVVTDSMGRFAFPNADRGQYMVRVTFPGYTERRIAVELKRGEGRELGVLLAPSFERRSRGEESALQDLSQRLSFGLQRERLSATELARHGAVSVCDLAQLRAEVGPEIVLIVNGTTVFQRWPLSSLCSWRADEVELVEFGRDACAEATRTVAELLGTWCAGRARNVPRGIDASSASRRGGSTSYVVIWEKK